MIPVTDILLTETNGFYDFHILNGDLVVGTSDPQSAELICYTTLGSFKQFPLVGVNLTSYLASSGQGATLERVIQNQLATDGFKVDEVVAVADGLTFILQIAANRLR